VANKDEIFSLVDISQGDHRRRINMLQTASSFKAKNLTAMDIESISGVMPDDVIKRIDKVLSTS
jgi:DNA polymerase III delta prime subunit